MKILHLDFDDLKNPQGGGQAIRTFEINRRLAKRHRITVTTGNYPGAKDERIEGIRYIRIGKGNFPWNIITFLASIPKVVKQFDHDILVENFTPPVGPAFTPIFTKKPVIAMVDWCFAREMSQKYKLPFFIAQSLGLKLYKNFIFPTRAIRDYLLEENKRNLNVTVLPNLMVSEFPRKIKNLKISNNLLFMGRLDIHQKGLDLLLRAFAQIVRNIPGSLLIAGEGRDKDRIQKMIRKLKLSRQVKLIGRISGKDKFNILSRARIVCIPSRYETSCIVASESLLLKKAMVTFDIPVLRETTQNQAIYARPFDIEDLAEKLLYAYKNSAGISSKIKFKPLPTWDEVAKKQEEFYLKIIR